MIYQLAFLICLFGDIFSPSQGATVGFTFHWLLRTASKETEPLCNIIPKLKCLSFLGTVLARMFFPQNFSVILLRKHLPHCVFDVQLKSINTNIQGPIYTLLLCQENLIVSCYSPSFEIRTSARFILILVFSTFCFCHYENLDALTFLFL